MVFHNDFPNKIFSLTYLWPCSMATQCFQSTLPQHSYLPHWTSPWPKPRHPSIFLNHCIFLDLTNTSSHLLLILGPKKCHHCWTAIHHNGDSTPTWKWTSSTTGPNLMGIQGVGLTYQPQERDLLLRYGLYTLTEDNKLILLFSLIFLTIGSSQIMYVLHLVALFCFQIKVERSFQV